MGDINLTGSGNQLDESLNTVKSEFKLLRDEAGKIRRLATFYRLEPHSGVSKIVHNYGRVVARNVADGEDTVQAEDLSDSLTTYTPSEVAVKVILAGSTLRRVADPSLYKKTGQIMHNAYDMKEDQDGAAQFSAFTVSLGSANTALSPGHIVSGVTSLRAGNMTTVDPEPAPSPIYGCFHPYQIHTLLARTIPLSPAPAGTSNYSVSSSESGASVAAGRSDMGDDILRKWLNAGEAARYAGIDIVMDANIPIVATTDAYGAIFSKEGLIYVEEVAAKMKADDSDISMRDAVEFVLWGSYCFGTYRPGHYGLACLFDATRPSA